MTCSGNRVGDLSLSLACSVPLGLVFPVTFAGSDLENERSGGLLGEADDKTPQT